MKSADISRLVVQSSSSGLITGDCLAQRYSLVGGARAQVVGQGAMAVHRRVADSGVSETLNVVVESGSRLELIQEPRLIFPGASYRQECRLDIHGELIFVDAMIAHPDPGPSSYFSEVSLVRGGVQVALERTGFENFDNSVVPATALILAVNIPVAPESWSGWLERHSSRESYGSISALPNQAGECVKIVAKDGRLLRAAVTEALEIFGAGDPRRYIGVSAG